MPKPTRPRRAALNRPVFAQTVFDSGALTVLTSLFHRFAYAGRYEVFVERGGHLVARFPLEVAAENAERQVNIDLAGLESRTGEERCCCREESGHKLGLESVAGFYVAKGSGRYRVRITTSDDDERKKRTLLDSEAGLPAGDLFAVTLVRPGVYLAAEKASKAKAKIRVRLPGDAKEYRPERPELVQFAEEGRFEPAALEIYSGQSVVVQCAAQARLRVKLVEPEDVGDPIGRKKLRFERPPRKKREG